MPIFSAFWKSYPWKNELRLQSFRGAHAAPPAVARCSSGRLKDWRPVVRRSRACTSAARQMAPEALMADT